jgi:cysteinyl-tRNA synthetase
MADLYLSNTLSQKKEKFVPIKEGEIGIYSCGPTVYWNQHIGHMYAYVQWDILVRFLRSQGNKVKWVMNITDVGHIVEDADVGEDKMEKGAKREGLTVWEIADKYIAQFKDSLKLLNVTSPDVLCRATEHIPEQIALIQKIEANGFTYKTQTGLVFDTSKFPGYADFARLNLEEQNAGARVEVDEEKKKPWDFLLWITNKPDHIMKWESPWGVGYPGWTIECTAMSVKYLGERFDIHTGGKEHIPVHHTNEIAQAFGAFGQQTANYWLHNEWLMFDGQKMSKSLGNMVTAQDLVTKDIDPLAMRYLILTSHYKQGLNFTWTSLEAAQQALTNVRTQINNAKTSSRNELSSEKLQKVDEYREKFYAALANDLGTPQAIAVLWDMLKSNIPSEDKYDLAMTFDEVLGLNLGQSPVASIQFPDEVKKLGEEREKLRKEGKYAEADDVRLKIEKLGYQVLDTKEGIKYEKRH